jgi:hypothetical protein
MKKWVLRILVLVIVVIIGVPILAAVYIDSIARSAVEQGGTYALGVDTTLESMDVGMLSGSVDLARLSVGNPQGFSTPHFLRLDDGRFAVSLGTLMDDKVVAPELVLSGVNMNLERKGGKANYSVIIDNLKRFESDEKPDAETPTGAESPKEGKKFVIEKVAINDVRVQVDLLPLGGELTRVPLRIERVELENVGSGSDGGIMLAQLTALLTEAILSAVVEKGGDLIPAEISGELAKGLEGLEGLKDATVKVIGQVTTELAEQVGDVTEQVTDQVGKVVDESGKKAAEGLEEAGKKLEEGLGGLLDRKKKEDE